MNTDVLYTPSYKLHSVGWIAASAVIGGPVAAGVMLWENYYNMKQPKRAFAFLFASLLFTVILIIALLLALPQSMVFGIVLLLPWIYGILAYTIAYKSQSKLLEDHIGQGGRLYSGWRAVGSSLLIGGVIALVGFSVLLSASGKDIETFHENLFTEYRANEAMICSHLDTIENDWETAVLGIKSSKYNDMLGMVSYELPKVVKRNAEIARILSKVRWKNNNTDAIAKEMKLLSEVRMHQKDMIVQKFWGKVPLLSSDYDQICGYIGQRTSALAVLLRGMPIKEE